MTKEYDFLCQVRHRVMSSASEVYQYTTWSDEFSRKEISEAFHISESKNKNIDPYKLTNEERRELGFCIWSKDDPIELIPLWIITFLRKDIPLFTIGGGMKRAKDADNDNRCGYSAYGII